ncbi:MAG TPA: hypothetical protein PLV89_04425 [Treponemataceae bacterium]|nr:hypothetical protein [Treponemataceae bacterium]
MSINDFSFELIFFSFLRSITDTFLALISAVFFEGKDLRLGIFLKILYKRYGDNPYSIFNELAGNLKENESLCKEIGSHFYIASCGLEPIIERFVDLNNLDADIIISSKMKKNTISGIISVRQKIQFLSKITNYIYFTDSFKEVCALRDKNNSDYPVVTCRYNGVLIYRLEVK